LGQVFILEFTSEFVGADDATVHLNVDQPLAIRSELNRRIQLIEVHVADLLRVFVGKVDFSNVSS